MGSKSRQPDQQVSIRADLSLYREYPLHKEERRKRVFQWAEVEEDHILFVWINTLISYFEAEDEALKPGIGWHPEMSKRERATSLYLDHE